MVKDESALGSWVQILGQEFGIDEPYNMFISAGWLVMVMV